MKKVLSMQQLRHALQNSDHKVFVFESEAQPGFDCTNPLSIKMFCWFSEVWPQTKTIVMKSNNGELCFRRVERVVEDSNPFLNGTTYTIQCASRGSSGRDSYYLTEFQ